MEDNKMTARYIINRYGGGFIIIDSERGKFGESYCGSDGTWRDQPVGMTPFNDIPEATKAIQKLTAEPPEGMTKEEWTELEKVGASDDPKDWGRIGDLIEKTMKEEEHPEDYNGPCLCQLCQSYGE